MAILELCAVALTLSVLLLPVHIVAFWMQKRRGRSVGEALRFSLVGVAVVFGFVFGLTALGAVADPDGRRGLDRTCDDLGGQIQTFAGPEGELRSICVAGG